MKKQYQSTLQQKAFDHISADLFLKHSVAEHDIITLQNMLLTTGIHHVSCSEPIIIRPIITRFLEALHHYQTVGFISFETFEEPMHSLTFEPLYHEVASRILDPDFLYDFALNELTYDFIWIEHHPLFDQLLSVIQELKIDKEMPILVVG